MPRVEAQVRCSARVLARHTLQQRQLGEQNRAADLSAQYPASSLIFRIMKLKFCITKYDGIPSGGRQADNQLDVKPDDQLRPRRPVPETLRRGGGYRGPARRQGEDPLSVAAGPVVA